MTDEGRVARVAFRVAMIAGAGLMFGLWIRTGAAQAERQSSVRSAAADIASRYLQAQEALTTVRTMALLSSVRVRDALLDPTSADLFEDRRQIVAAHTLIKLLLEDYQPVMNGASAGTSLGRLASEIDQLNAASLEVLSEGRHSPAEIRDVLNQRIVPRRDAVLEIAEGIQALNRTAFIARQAEVLAAHEAADLQVREQLGAALIVGLVALLFALVYAGRLESRLKARS